MAKDKKKQPEQEPEAQEKEPQSPQPEEAEPKEPSAADQLEIWAQRADVPIVRQKEGADPAL